MEGGEPVFSADVRGLSRAEQRALKRSVKRELRRQLKDKRAEARSLQADAKAASKAKAKRADAVYKNLKANSKGIKELTEAPRARRDRAKETVDAIGYELMYKNGICEVEPGLFSETIEFDDITYQNARDDDQMSMLKVLFSMYNYFRAGTSIQLSVINTPLRREEVESRTFYDPAAQATPTGEADAREMNRILNDKLREGVSNIKRRRLLTVSTLAKDADEAFRSLSRINTDVAVTFEQLRCGWRVLSGAERLELVAGVTRPGEPFSFDYDRSLSVRSALTTKDYVSPMTLDFAPEGNHTWYESDGKCCQALVMRDLDSPMEDGAIAELANLAMPINVSWFLSPIDKSEAINFVKTRGAWIDAEIIQMQQKAVSKGYDYSILPSETQSTREATAEVLAQIEGPQHLFRFSGVIWTWAEDFDTLRSQVLQIVDKAAAAGITVELLEYRQRQGMNSALPLGLCHVDVSRQLTTSEASILVPFATVELDDEGGNWYYQNKTSNNLAVGNRARLTSPVGFVSGKTGSGKGFFVKNEIECTMLSKPRDQVIVIDRAGEYLELVKHWGGLCATFGVGQTSHLNPLAMTGLEGMADETQIAFKADAVLAQAGASAEESGMPLTDEERSVIQRCVERTYMEARVKGREPLLEDLYQALLDQPEGIAGSIALRYERFCHGATNFFNFPGNVDFSKRIVDLNLKEVPESMLVFALVTLCESIRFQMYSNHARGVRTWLYVEEMESLFKYQTVLNYFARFSRECRKFGMYLTGITQSAQSMMANPEASAIVKQSDFIMLLKQSKEDSNYWAETLGLSPMQLGCIDDSTPRGNGLLVFGGSRIPIKGDFPTDSYLYDLYSTDPNEAEARRARLAGTA